MSYPINYPTPQNANVQIFNGDNSIGTAAPLKTWIKPQGASFVWFTLIGAGGNGDGTTGGGSGAVTNFMCPAFLIPDQLGVRVANYNTTGNSEIVYQQKDGDGYSLLTAGSGSGSAAGASMSANFFTPIGFFQSVDGQSGSTTNIAASGTTFLSGGGDSTNNQASNYGYTVGTTGNRNGFFQMQPIIVGAGGMGNAKGGIGCGAGVGSTIGGNGLVVIITW